MKVLKAQPSRKSGTKNSSTFSLHVSFDLSHTQKAAKLRHHPQIDSLLYNSAFDLLLHLVSSGLVDQHARVGLGSCKRVHSMTDRPGQSRASSLKGSKVETTTNTI